MDYIFTYIYPFELTALALLLLGSVIFWSYLKKKEKRINKKYSAVYNKLALEFLIALTNMYSASAINELMEEILIYSTVVKDKNVDEFLKEVKTRLGPIIDTLSNVMSRAMILAKIEGLKNSSINSIKVLKVTIIMINIETVALIIFSIYKMQNGFYYLIFGTLISTLVFLLLIYLQMHNRAKIFENNKL
jgi:hypothetical protein